MERKKITKQQAVAIVGGIKILDFLVSEVDGLGVVASLRYRSKLRVLRDCGRQYFVIDQDDDADETIQDLLEELESGEKITESEFHEGL